MSSAIKNMTAIRRRDDIDHERLLAHWRDPHAPGVKAFMKPDRYAITFFDPRDGKAAFDGMAALAYDDPAVAKARSGRNAPPEVANDGFVDLTSQMLRTKVLEHVIVPGPTGARATAAEREAAYKMTFLVSARDGEDPAAVHRHWLELHAPNVRSNFVESGGVRYVVNLADLAAGPQAYLGIAELWYRDRDAFKGHRIADDGFNARTTGIPLSGKEWVVVDG